MIFAIRHWSLDARPPPSAAAPTDLPQQPLQQQRHQEQLHGGLRELQVPHCAGFLPRPADGWLGQQLRRDQHQQKEVNNIFLTAEWLSFKVCELCN